MKRIAGISLWALLLLLYGMACDTSTKPGFNEEDGTITSIRELKTLCKGTSARITREVRIRGVVTANDYLNEFPNTLFIEDATGGIEILVDHSSLWDLFPLDATVTVYCDGLSLGEYGGRIRLGAPPTGTYSVDRIPGTEISRYIRRTELNTHLRRPRILQFGEVGLSDADTYVCFENVRFRETGAWCDRNPETGDLLVTTRTLINTDGNEFRVRILPTCTYAAGPIPSGMGSVDGIIDYFNGEFSLRIMAYGISFPVSATHPRAYPSVGECSVPIPTK